MTGGIYGNDLWQFDPITHFWTKKAPFPGGFAAEGVAFVIGDNAYVVIRNAAWQYNQPADQWTQKASLPGVSRLGGSGFAINGKGYVGLGYDEVTTALQNDWWQYDPATDQWTSKQKFPGTRVEAATSFAVDGKGYVIGGRHYGNGKVSYSAAVWQYHPVADSWTQKANFPGMARESAVGASGTIDGMDFGFVAGGDPGTALVPFDNDCWEYNPATDAWGQVSNMPGERNPAPAGFVIGRSLFIANVSVVVLNWSK
jgi:N-acetylneuraminic acid mutarotase